MFEGSEKKLEIIVSKKAPSLHSFPEKYWSKIVKACGAEIISSTKHSKIKSYLLSESSLFLWDHRLVMITCGKTILPKAFLQILKFLKIQWIDFLFFQRKNEFFPENQKSCFLKDIKIMKKKVDGKAYRFGRIHQHHCFLFHTETDSIPDFKDRTLELLMYDSETVKDTYPNTINRLKKQLEGVFPNFEIQDHYFKPEGYSLNAIRKSDYYTIHITPQEPFYISFECSLENLNFSEIVNQLIPIFKMKSFDVIFFQTIGQDKENYENKDFFKTSEYHKVLNCRYEVSYMSFQFNKVSSYEAIPLLT